MTKRELERASIQAWNTRLYEELEKPRYRKLNKQAKKARKQARYRRELIESLNASASRVFTPKIIRRAKLAGDMQSSKHENGQASKLDSVSSQQASLSNE